MNSFTQILTEYFYILIDTDKQANDELG